jgi:hypothetical protein
LHNLVSSLAVKLNVGGIHAYVFMIMFNSSLCLLQSCELMNIEGSVLVSPCPAVAGPSGRGGSVKPAMTEEEQLQMALAMSVEAVPGKAAKHARNGSMDMAVDSDEYANDGGDDDDDDELDEEAIWAEIRKREEEEKEQLAAAAGVGTGQSGGASGSSSRIAQTAGAEAQPAAAGPRDVAAVQASAQERLPAEPAVGADGRCRVGLRLPDGTRPTRWFLKTDKVALLLVSG